MQWNWVRNMARQKHMHSKIRMELEQYWVAGNIHDFWEKVQEQFNVGVIVAHLTKVQLDIHRSKKKKKERNSHFM